VTQTYVLSMKWDDMLEGVGMDKEGPRWRRVVVHCRVCDEEMDSETLLTLCSMECIREFTYQVRNETPSAGPAFTATAPTSLT
jgi:hypothetical protein